MLAKVYQHLSLNPKHLLEQHVGLRVSRLWLHGLGRRFGGRARTVGNRRACRTHGKRRGHGYRPFHPSASHTAGLAGQRGGWCGGIHHSWGDRVTGLSRTWF